MAGGLEVPNDRGDEKWATHYKNISQVGHNNEESGSSSEMIMGSKQILGIMRWDSDGQETFKTGGKNLCIRVGESGGYV